MPLKLPVPDVAWAQQDITLGQQEYTFTYSYNSRDSRWRFAIDLAGREIITGVKVMEDQSLLARYGLVDFRHGDVYCVRLEQDDNPVGRNNLGIGRSYELIYYTNEEIAAL